jgi:hypothetical protein
MQSRWDESKRPSEPSASIPSGADRDRTGDPLLAKQVLSQLSYRPICGRTIATRRSACHRVTPDDSSSPRIE